MSSMLACNTFNTKLTPSLPSTLPNIHLRRAGHVHAELDTLSVANLHTSRTARLVHLVHELTVPENMEPGAELDKVLLLLLLLMAAHCCF